MYKVLGSHTFSFLLVIYIIVGLMGYVVTLCFNLLRKYYHFFIIKFQPNLKLRPHA